jgi:hypothetical protein
MGGSAGERQCGGRQCWKEAMLEGGSAGWSSSPSSTSLFFFLY